MQRVCAILIVIIFIMSVAFWISMGTARGAALNSGCIACHAEAVESGQMQPFVHAPFQDGACSVCHAEEADSVQADARNGIAVSERSALDSESIRAVDVRWVREYFEPVRHLIVPLETSEVQNMLVVEIWDQCRAEHQHLIPLPALNQVMTMPTRNKNAFILHEISLQRNSIYPDTVVVECGSTLPFHGRVYVQRGDEPARVIETDPGYHVKVAMNIEGLASDTRYSVFLEAVDVEGRQQRSPVQVFVPAYLPTQSSSTVVGSNEECDGETEFSLYRGLDGGTPCYLLEIEASHPVTLSVGTLKSTAVTSKRQDVSEGQRQAQNPADSGRPGYHPDIADPYFTNYSACRACHAEFFGPMSHPVDIVPDEKMPVSAELRLLPDGRISCMTCHEIHAGNDHYRLRFKSRQKLCNACHEHY